jgi:hypothetical protein
MGWGLVAATVDAATGRRLVLSGLVVVGPCLVFLTGRWLRTAAAGAWAICLVALLGGPDGTWGSRLETVLISLAVLVAMTSTLALLVTVRSALSLVATALLAAACSGPGASSGRDAASSSPRPASCREQYEAWKAGPGPAADRRLKAAVRVVRGADAAGSASALLAAMRKLMPAAIAAGLAGPIPHCTDPDGLYARYVVVVYDAGEKARKAHGLAALREAAAPLRRLPALESALAAEAGRAAAHG